jgi:hypothetical protein
MADLLNIWSVAKLGAKYVDPYAVGKDRKVATFKALAETWQRPGVKQWHKYLGDFWGPIVLYMRRHKDWMPIAEAFNTGIDHGFCGKSQGEIVEAWRRGECEASTDAQVVEIFTPIISEIRLAYAHHDHPVPNERWRNMNVGDLEMQVAVPLDTNFDATWEALPLDPGKDDKTVFQWVSQLDSLLNRNREEITAPIARNGPDLQEKLEEMAERMKNMWAHATEDKRATWTELKRTTFGASELHTKLLDVICSFESRWIPQEHCACQSVGRAGSPKSSPTCRIL